MSSSTPPAQRSEPRGGLDRFFSITRRGSTVGREVRGGVATFIAMSYIVVLNPLVLGYGPDGAGNTLGGERVAAGRFDLADHRLGLPLAAGVIDDDREAVLGKPLGHGGADAARRPGHNRHLVGLTGHLSLHRSRVNFDGAKLSLPENQIIRHKSAS